MAQSQTAQASEASQLTEYAQAVILILKKLGVLTIAVTIPVTAFFTTRYDTKKGEVYLLDSERTAALTVDSARSAVVKGEWFKVKVKLDTGGSKVTEAKAVLRYDQDKLKLERVNFASYAKNNHTAIDNDQGRTTVTSFFNADAPGYFQGRETWLEVVFSTHSQGLADFWFDCRRNSEDETNIIRFGGGDIVNCNNLGQGWFTVNLVDSSSVISDQDSVCSSTPPSVPANLTAYSGPGKGEVSLKWNKVSQAAHYAITYGLNSGSYQYGSPDVSDIDQFVVRGLVPGRRYYFVVTAVNSCASSGYSNEASATAGYGAISKTSYDYGEEKGFQPPLPPEFLPEESTPSAEATPSSIRKPLDVSPAQASPASEAGLSQEEGTTKPWQNLDFWLLALGIALGGLFLILVGSLLGRKCAVQEEVPSSVPVEPPPSLWQEEKGEEEPINSI